MNAEPEFMDLVLQGADKYGWLFPSSRISNTRLSVYEECEALLAQLTGSEGAVLLPSGFAAGRLATSYHQGKVHNAPGSHPAILQHKSALNSFNDWSNWALQQTGDANLDNPLIIASDSVNPLTATIYNFSFLASVKSPVLAIIDDSHGIGVIGTNGAGVSALVPQNKHVEYLFTYSLSKAFGISGGAISCSKEQVTAFKNRPEYSAVTPLSPAQVFAFNQGQHIYARQRERLMQNITYFENCIKDMPGIQHHAGLPVFVLPTLMDEGVFLDAGILISSFAYPDPMGQTLKRVVLNALHTPRDLDFLASVLQMAYQASPSLFP